MTDRERVGDWYRGNFSSTAFLQHPEYPAAGQHTDSLPWEVTFPSPEGAKTAISVLLTSQQRFPNDFMAAQQIALHFQSPVMMAVRVTRLQLRGSAPAWRGRGRGDADTPSSSGGSQPHFSTVLALWLDLTVEPGFAGSVHGGEPLTDQDIEPPRIESEVATEATMLSLDGRY